MTPVLLPFQPLSRHVKAIMMPPCLLPHFYYGDFVVILPLLLLCELDFAVIRLPILPCLTFHPVRFLPSFDQCPSIYHIIPIVSFSFSPSGLLPLAFPPFILLPSLRLPAFPPSLGPPCVRAAVA